MRKITYGRAVKKVEEEPFMRRPLLVLAAVLAGVAAVAPAAGTPAQTPKRGGTLVFAQPQPEPACLNLLVEKCAPGTTILPLERIWNRVLEAPFEVGPDFTWRPKLVSRATFTSRPPFVLTYHIRPEARWSDGVPVTARDFAFTHRAILRSESVEQYDIKALHANVRLVRALDAKTVRVVLRSRLAGWRGLFGGILPAHALQSESFDDVWRDRIDNPKTGRPIGTGPFLTGRWERGRQLTLVRNPDYWGPHPAYLGRLVVQFAVDGNDVAEGLRQRRIDVASGFPPAFVSDVEREAGAEVVSSPSTGWEHLDFRLGPGGNPLLRSKVVRRALAYGVNRVALVQQLVRESHLRFRALDSSVFLTQSRFYKPNWNRYRHRPKQARRLLEQVGCRLGSDGIYSCNGVRLSLRFFTHVSPGSVRPHVLELLQAQLRQVGVEVVPTFAPQAVIFGPGGIRESGAFDGVLYAWVLFAPDEGKKGLFGCGQNYMGYCQRLVTAELDQAERILAADRQARALNRADAQMSKDVPMLPLFQNAIWAAFTPDVRGYVLSPVAGDALLGAEDWWLAE